MTWMKEPEFFSQKVVVNGHPYQLHPRRSTTTKREVYHCELWSVVITAVVTRTSTTVSIIQHKNDGNTIGLIVTPDRAIRTIELLLGSEEEPKDDTKTRYPPPEVFSMTQVGRGDLTLVEANTGFFIRHNTTDRTRWLSDGVDMFFDDDHDEAISPGTMEWWFAAYEWLSDETELMEAYFPEVTYDM